MSLSKSKRKRWYFLSSSHHNEHCDMLSLSVVIADRDADKSWSGSESELDSEDKGVNRPPLSRPLPSSSTSLQLPVATPPASLPHPPQMSSTPFSSTHKVTLTVSLCGTLSNSLLLYCFYSTHSTLLCQVGRVS